MVPQESLEHNITLPSLPILTRHKTILDHLKEKAMVQNQISQLDIVPPVSSKIMEEFSGGNQQKAMLGKWMATQPTILILDEPTIGVDIRTREYLYGTMSDLAKEGMSLLLMSSDLKEVLRLSNRVLLMRNGRFVGELPGDTAMED